MKTYLWNNLIAFDQQLNTLLGGSPDETLSARAYRVERKSRLWGVLLRPVIDAIFFVLTLGKERDHCRQAYESEQSRQHLPPDYQRQTS